MLQCSLRPTFVMTQILYPCSKLCCTMSPAPGVVWHFPSLIIRISLLYPRAKGIHKARRKSFQTLAQEEILRSSSNTSRISKRRNGAWEMKTLFPTVEPPTQACRMCRSENWKGRHFTSFLDWPLNFFCTYSNTLTFFVLALPGIESSSLAAKS